MSDSPSYASLSTSKKTKKRTTPNGSLPSSSSKKHAKGGGGQGGTKVSKKRVDVTIDKPFLFGNVSWPLGKRAAAAAAPNTHKWTVYVRGVNNESLAPFISKVEFHLHPSFKNHIRVVEKPPFQVTATGWGEFQMKIVIYFNDPTTDKPAELIHTLKLFPLGYVPGKTAQLDHRIPVIAEQYDEFMFVGPNESFYQALSAHTCDRSNVLPPPGCEQKDAQHHYGPFEEQSELSSMIGVHSKVKEEIEKMRDLVERAQEEDDSLAEVLAPVV
eukprot:TRINITY_DN13244_c0_g1_i1.p1 TRINITY_DN13244_c0_g1~~TRINITY_DN13244_c0_g1_i1.p1  ORF type:complete len:271 (-),score=71.57 TRINITY_DN13244_c0_g1_i1:31-843(-)